MICTPRMDSLILIQVLVTNSLIRKLSLMETLMGAHQIFDITTPGMEGSHLGTGIIPQQSGDLTPLLLLQNGIMVVVMLI